MRYLRPHDLFKGLQRPGRLIGVDIGRLSLGLALSDTNYQLAFPLWYAFITLLTNRQWKQKSDSTHSFFKSNRDCQPYLRLQCVSVFICCSVLPKDPNLMKSPFLMKQFVSDIRKLVGFPSYVTDIDLTYFYFLL